MPAMSCRDWDEICDWFWRDEDPLKLLISDQTHSEEQHAAYVKVIIDDALSGKTPISQYYEKLISLMRWP